MFEMHLGRDKGTLMTSSPAKGITPYRPKYIVVWGVSRWHPNGASKWDTDIVADLGCIYSDLG